MTVEMEMLVASNRQNLLCVATGLRNVSERLAGGGGWRGENDTAATGRDPNCQSSPLAETASEYTLPWCHLPKSTDTSWTKENQAEIRREKAKKGWGQSQSFIWNPPPKDKALSQLLDSSSHIKPSEGSVA